MIAYMFEICLQPEYIESEKNDDEKRDIVKDFQLFFQALLKFWP